jgi:hypothetical protein
MIPSPYLENSDLDLARRSPFPWFLVYPWHPERAVLFPMCPGWRRHFPCNLSMANFVMHQAGGWVSQPSEVQGEAGEPIQAKDSSK